MIGPAPDGFPAPHRAALLLLLTVAALALLAGTASASPWAGADHRLADKINAERAAAGKGALRVDAELQRVARDWTAVMASQDRLFHNPNLGSQVQRDCSSSGRTSVGRRYPEPQRTPWSTACTRRS